MDLFDIIIHFIVNSYAHFSTLNQLEVNLASFSLTMFTLIISIWIGNHLQHDIKQIESRLNKIIHSTFTKMYNISPTTAPQTPIRNLYVFLALFIFLYLSLEIEKITFVNIFLSLFFPIFIYYTLTIILYLIIQLCRYISDIFRHYKFTYLTTKMLYLDLAFFFKNLHKNTRKNTKKNKNTYRLCKHSSMLIITLAFTIWNLALIVLFITLILRLI